MAAGLLLCISVAGNAADSLVDNIKGHIRFLCSPALEGRKAGSAGERAAAGYLYDQLDKIGITMLSGRDGDTFTVIGADGDTIASRNIVGIIEGIDPKLRDEYIVVGAHIDHLGAYSVSIDGNPVRRIYPGADANASGVAALIEAARILASYPEGLSRSVLLVGFGAMEEEFAGSRYFALAGGFSQIANVKMMVNLDMLGRGNASNPFEIYHATDPALVSGVMSQVLRNESVSAIPGIHKGVVFPSDNLAFKQAAIPNLTFSTGISKEYRTTMDTPELVLYDNLAAETVYIAAFIKTVCNSPGLSAGDVAKDSESVYAASDCDTPPLFFRKDVQYFLDSWVYKYLKYPNAAVEAGIQGTVYVSFIIEADGQLSNVAVERGVSETLDAEALKVVGASPKWIPATIDGKKVRTKIVIPIEFRLKKR